MGAQAPANIHADWAVLDEIVQGLFLIARGVASQEHKRMTLAKVDEAECGLDAMHIINEIVKNKMAALPPAP